MNPTYRAQADALLPSWFKTWAPHGTRVLVTSFPASLVAGLANAYTLRHHEATYAMPFYCLGTFFALAHFFYGPRALRLLKAIRNAEPEGRTTKSMGDWLRMHSVRTVTTDLLAFVCFTVAAVLAI
ncbi:Integral membrane protein [Mycena sanguinolenta]|uniref:Integral membrane protein n=1 Tax=Mycena sanguinolenta TaxID=230812 RepID=A0A8H7DDN7_9AGAR|nr:Integral membrane protein [Mycena sanguinolenta]